MPAPLLTRDARELRLLGRPLWQRRILAWSLPAAAFGLILVHTLSVGPDTCTAQDPCRPEPDGSVYLGLLIASAFAGFIYPRLAVWLAGGFLVGLIVSERLLRPRLVSPAWLYVIDLGFVGLCALLGNVSRDRRPTDIAQRWLAGVRRERPPAQTNMPRPGRRWRTAAYVLWLLAAACLAWGWYAQQEADGRQRAATRATAEVIAHPDPLSVDVRLGGETTRINVFDAMNYPVGSRMELYIDDRGLRQPVSEPYDATGWILLGTFLAGIGWLGWARGVEKGNGPRTLFAEEQPITEVSVRPGVGRFAVYAGDARPGEPAIAEIRTALPLIDGGPAGEAGSFLDSRVHPASLYGIPAPGHWCAIVVNAAVVVPTHVISARAVHAPPYASEVEILDDPSPGAELPLRVEEVAALPADDRDVSPDQVRYHVRSPLVGYAFAASTMVFVLTALRWLPDLPPGVLALMAGVLVAVTCVLSWRLFMRGRIAWNGHGLAVAGVTGYKRVSWRMVSAIERDRDSVVVHTGYSRLVVGAGSLLGIFGRSDRTVEELTNALRHAKYTAQVGNGDAGRPGQDVPGIDVAPAGLNDLPQLDVPRPPVGLYALWLVCTPTLAWLLQIV